MTLLLLYRKERLRNDYEKEVGQNPTQKELDNFKEKNTNRASPPRGYVEALLERLSETIDTSNMKALGLSNRLRRIKDPSTMQIWKELFLLCRILVLERTRDIDENCRVVTTTLRQIVRGEHSITDIEQQLLSEQKVNHQVFETFCDIIRDATDMIISGKVFSLVDNPDAGCLDLAKVFTQVRNESELFAQIRKEINSKKEVSLKIAGATSNHAIRKASLKEAYTSVTNIWMGDIYNRSLRNFTRILLRIHLAPARMVRTVSRRPTEENWQTEKEQQGLDRRFRNPKHQISRLMNELGIAIINNRLADVLGKGEQREEGTLSSLDSDSEDANDEEEKEDQNQESSAKTIRETFSAAFKGTTFTKKEKMIATNIINFLRPFIQQRTDDNQLPEPHILMRAPLAALANAIATITGFPSLVRSLSITSQQDPRSLQLTAAGVYDTFRGQWDIPTDNGNWITNSYKAGKNKPATFGAFLDINRIESFMDSYGLRRDAEFEPFKRGSTGRSPCITSQRLDIIGVESDGHWPEVQELEKALARTRSSLYSLNKALRATNSTRTTIISGNANLPYEAKKDSLNGIRNEYYMEKQKVVFSGTDPGTVTTSITDSAEETSEATPQIFDVDFLPRSYKITAELINKENQQKKRAKENWAREIRTKRVYGKIAAKERRHIRAHAQLPPDLPKPALIHCVGHWQGINSYIKEHSRREMKQIRV
ncbi:10154_t:CDS:10 [Ambispora leptoticha]|uniref:10154_t:CDS:1 n=1 Tax=Ambispora leptoticha TaxID=144679 RepID=A0A9N8VKT7_9GLOM|nr:10154_t:CDS:10 [Ambispora leptoticha]